MKICLDGFSLSSLKGTGLYSYSLGLVENLASSYPQEELHLIWDNSPVMKWESIKNIEFASLNINRINGDFSNVENYLKAREVDLYHSPNNGFSLPKNKTCKYVITVHDLIALSSERYVDKQYKDKFLSCFPISVMLSDKIIAVSNSIKSELLTYFSLQEDKIEVIYPISAISAPLEENLNIKNLLKYKYNIEGPFILYAGSIHQRKNLRTILTAFKTLVKKHPELKLVISGKTDGKRASYYNSLVSLSNLLGIRKAVIFTGTVSSKDMYHLYSCCECFINLSEYEGFPLTSLEAMQCGAPVISSSIPSMKEVVGSGGVLIEEITESEIIDNVLMVVNNRDYKEKLKASALKQAEGFDASLSSKKLVSLYENL